MLEVSWQTLTLLADIGSLALGIAWLTLTIAWQTWILVLENFADIDSCLRQTFEEDSLADMDSLKIAWQTLTCLRITWKTDLLVDSWQTWTHWQTDLLEEDIE